MKIQNGIEKVIKIKNIGNWKLTNIYVKIQNWKAGLI